MQKWEYLTVAIWDHKLEQVNDRKVSERTLASDYFNRLGADGWELVAAAGRGDYTYEAIFKRPKS